MTNENLRFITVINQPPVNPGDIVLSDYSRETTRTAIFDSLKVVGRTTLKSLGTRVANEVIEITPNREDYLIHGVHLGEQVQEINGSQERVDYTNQFWLGYYSNADILADRQGAAA